MLDVGVVIIWREVVPDPFRSVSGDFPPDGVTHSRSLVDTLGSDESEYEAGG